MKAWLIFRWLALFLLAGFLAVSFFPGSTGLSVPVPVEPDVRRDPTVIAVEQVLPSVVNIATVSVVPVRDFREATIRRMYGRELSDTLVSAGSGVIIDEAGYLLTNDHVVQDARQIAVQFNSGTNLYYEATVIARDSKRDVALLKLNAQPGEKFHAIKLAREDDLLLGETVLALGNPFGLGGTVTRGILSSKSRLLPKQGDRLGLRNCLQTDAPINEGNSGGPLINLRGELIGINVAVVNEVQDKPAQGLGFAIPIRIVEEALADILPTEFVKSYWFGARVKVGSYPLVVTSVQPESPAGKMGLAPGDMILRVNGKAPRSFLEFADLLATNAQSEAALAVQRGSEQKTIGVKLVPEKSVFNGDLIRNKLGMGLEEWTPQLAEQYANAAEGFVISEIQENGPAAKAHLQTRMLVNAIDGQVPPDLSGIAKLLYAKKAGEVVRLDVTLLQRTGGFNVLRQLPVELTVR